MGGDELFDELPESSGGAGRDGAGEARLLRADRRQLRLLAADLDGWLPEDHMARAVWQWVEMQDLSALYDAIKARGSRPGRPAIDPAILVALWLYATIEGVGSARHVARLIERDLAYMWIAGGVQMEARVLSDFRAGEAKFLDGLLSQSVAALVKEGLVQLDSLALDGVRVRAHAGKSSFRRAESLEKLEKEAQERIAALKAELDADPGAGERRARAARQRAAQQRGERIAQAKKRLEELQEKHESRLKKARCKSFRQKQHRASTSDAKARIMKMADGGFRPAYNLQALSDPLSGIVVATGIDTSGSDHGLIEPAIAEALRRYGVKPKALIADGGFFSHAEIEWLNRQQPAIAAYLPPPASKKHPDANAARHGDGPGVAALRQRMASEQGKDIYKLRAQAELPHARMRRQGFNQLLLRGPAKALTLFNWQALANNLVVLIGIRRRKAKPA